MQILNYTLMAILKFQQNNHTNFFYARELGVKESEGQ